MSMLHCVCIVLATELTRRGQANKLGNVVEDKLDRGQLLFAKPGSFGCPFLNSCGIWSDGNGALSVVTPGQIRLVEAS
jgi:hypothetical protein